MTPEMYTSSVDNQALNPAVIITKKNATYNKVFSILLHFTFNFHLV